jgi:catechol 2,3-dioxygenase-like lactoylglutathione lyase family enzyme
VVKNLDRSVQFYRGLGFYPVQGSREIWDGATLNIMKMGTVGGVLELVEGVWRPHIAINTNELERLAWGRDIVNRPTVRVCFIEDPDGNWIELVEEK